MSVRAEELSVGDKFTWDDFPKFGEFTVTDRVYGVCGGVRANNPTYGVGVFKDELVTPVKVEDTKSTGGPSKYYDVFPEVITTANDVIEHLSNKLWLEHSCHMKDIFKAITRWGSKDGTSKEYDARKVVYSGLRLLIMIVGVDKTKEYLQELMDSKQFGGTPEGDN